MKKILAILLLSVLLVSCGEYEPEENKVDIKEELKINACVLNRNLEGNGYWEYIDFKDMKKLGEGYWHTDDGKVYESKDVFAIERLEVGEVRTLAPLGYAGSNINIWFDCDDIIEFETIPSDDKTLQVAYSLEDPLSPSIGDWTLEHNFRMRGPAAVNICPIGYPIYSTELVTETTLENREYNFIVRTYNESNELLVTAELRLVSVEDEGLPDDYSNSIFSYTANHDLTRFLTIELVSYEYSDVYKLDESTYEE